MNFYLFTVKLKQTMNRLILRRISSGKNTALSTTLVQKEKDFLSPTARYWFNRLLAGRGVKTNHVFNNPSELINTLGWGRCFGIVMVLTFL